MATVEVEGMFDEYLAFKGWWNWWTARLGLGRVVMGRGLDKLVRVGAGSPTWS